MEPPKGQLVHVQDVVWCWRDGWPKVGSRKRGAQVLAVDRDLANMGEGRDMQHGRSRAWRLLHGLMARGPYGGLGGSCPLAPMFIGQAGSGMYANRLTGDRRVISCGDDVIPFSLNLPCPFRFLKENCSAKMRS